MFRF
jgi:hypothetical protein